MKWFASLALLALASCVGGVPSQLTAMLLAYDEHPVQVAALVVDLDTGDTLLARDATRLFRPASTQKLLVTAAICRREPDGVLTTSLSASALPEGVVTLVAGGDPMLRTEELRDLALQLQANGLQQVVGQVQVVDGLRDAPRFGEGWMWDDEPDAFAPVLSAACVDAGCVTVAVEPDGAQLAARLLPVAGALQLRVEAAPHSLQVSRSRYAGADQVTVVGSLLDDKPQMREITVPVPARFTGYVLADALRRAGVLQGDPLVHVLTEVPMQRHGEVCLRRPIAEVVRHTNKVSDNLGAEMLLRRLGAMAKQASPGDESLVLRPEATAAGVAALTADLLELGCSDASFRIADGSGVSHYNLVSADLLVRLLVAMHRRADRGYEVFRASLPIAGVDGTLASRMQQTAAEGRVRAKTGTVSAVSNLAGYIDSRSGRRFAFAILCQNFVGKAGPWRDLQDRICAVLADL